MSSQHQQTKSTETPTNQTQPRRSIYLSAPNRCTNHENNQTSKTNGNENSAAQEQKTFRYIKYLKEQNVQLKQQLDKERQASSFRGGIDNCLPRGNDQLSQIQVHQFQIQLASLQNEFIRYKNQNESQYKERLDQIESLLREKQNFMIEKEKLANKNKSLADQVQEFKHISDGLAPEDRRKQVKEENDKLKEEHNRIKSKIDEVRSQRDKAIEENEKLQKEINRLKNENKKLKQSNQVGSRHQKQSEQKSSESKPSEKKHPATRTTERSVKKPRSSSAIPREASKSSQRFSINHKQEPDTKKKARPDSVNLKTRQIKEPNSNSTDGNQDRINDLQEQVNSLSQQLKDKNSKVINQEKINDLQTQVQVLSQQLKSKSELIDKLKAKNSEENKTYEKLRSANAELSKKCNKYIDETNICNATIIRQKNNLDDKDKEIDALQMKQSKIKKLIKVVSNIKNTNIILNERNRDLEQRIRDSANPTPNLTINSNSNCNNNNEQVIELSKIDSLLNDLK